MRIDGFAIFVDGGGCRSRLSGCFEVLVASTVAILALSLPLAQFCVTDNSSRESLPVATAQSQCAATPSESGDLLWDMILMRVERFFLFRKSLARLSWEFGATMALTEQDNIILDYLARRGHTQAEQALRQELGLSLADYASRNAPSPALPLKKSQSQQLLADPPAWELGYQGLRDFVENVTPPLPLPRSHRPDPLLVRSSHSTSTAPSYCRYFYPSSSIPTSTSFSPTVAKPPTPSSTASNPTTNPPTPSSSASSPPSVSPTISPNQNKPLAGATNATTSPSPTAAGASSSAGSRAANSPPPSKEPNPGVATEFSPSSTNASTSTVSPHLPTLPHHPTNALRE